jgi:hypothetical protein
MFIRCFYGTNKALTQTVISIRHLARPGNHVMVGLGLRVGVGVSEVSEVSNPHF